eukprot:6476337-Amphidinium_carterae.4
MVPVRFASLVTVCYGLIIPCGQTKRPELSAPLLSMIQPVPDRKKPSHGSSASADPGLAASSVSGSPLSEGAGSMVPAREDTQPIERYSRGQLQTAIEAAQRTRHRQVHLAFARSIERADASRRRVRCEVSAAAASALQKRQHLRIDVRPPCVSHPWLTTLSGTRAGYNQIATPVEPDAYTVDGSFVTKRAMVQTICEAARELKLGDKTGKRGGHSLRRGGAAFAASRRVLNFDIKYMAAPALAQ